MPAALVHSRLGLRHHPNWIEAFMSDTSGTDSPVTLRRWAGIYTIASALERCCWLTSNKGQMYPNLFIFLVAPPGVGKSLILKQSRLALESLGDESERIHTSPSNMSSAALIDALDAAKRRIDVVSSDPLKPFPTFNSLCVMVPELGTLFPSYDTLMMAMLTDLWDCDFFKEKKRGGGLSIEIPNGQINMLTGCTPSALHQLVPPAGWDQGFMSRVIMAYSGENVGRPMFGDAAPASLSSELLEDLADVFKMYGEFGITEEYKAAFHSWQDGRYEPVPTHPKLLHYNTRRPAIVLKLSMVASANESSDLVITEDHFAQALQWLTDAEAFMPEIFKQSGMGGDSALMYETFHFLWNTYKSTQKPISEAKLLGFLRSRVSSFLINQIIDVMVRSNMIEKQGPNGGTPLSGSNPFYKPLPESHHRL